MLDTQSSAGETESPSSRSPPSHQQRSDQYKPPWSQSPPTRKDRVQGSPSSPVITQKITVRPKNWPPNPQPSWPPQGNQDPGSSTEHPISTRSRLWPPQRHQSSESLANNPSPPENQSEEIEKNSGDPGSQSISEIKRKILAYQQIVEESRTPEQIAKQKLREKARELIRQRNATQNGNYTTELPTEPGASIPTLPSLPQIPNTPQIVLHPDHFAVRRTQSDKAPPPRRSPQLSPSVKSSDKPIETETSQPLAPRPTFYSSKQAQSDPAKPSSRANPSQSDSLSPLGSRNTPPKVPSAEQVVKTKALSSTDSESFPQRSRSPKRSASPTNEKTPVPLFIQQRAQKTEELAPPSSAQPTSSVRTQSSKSPKRAVSPARVQSKPKARKRSLSQPLPGHSSLTDSEVRYLLALQGKSQEPAKIPTSIPIRPIEKKMPLDIVPIPSRPPVIETNRQPTYLKLQFISTRGLDTNLKLKDGISAHLFRRNILSSDQKGEKVFSTTCVKTNQSLEWNELFQLNINDAENEQICIRFMSGKHFNSKSVAYLGEVIVQLRAAVRDFDSPHYKCSWLPIRKGLSNGCGEVKLYLEYFDTRHTSSPTDMKKNFGWNDGCFDIKNIPIEWRNKFASLGIKPSRLTKKENAEFTQRVLQIMEDEASGSFGEGTFVLNLENPDGMKVEWHKSEKNQTDKKKAKTKSSIGERTVVEGTTKPPLIETTNQLPNEPSPANFPSIEGVFEFPEMKPPKVPMPSKPEISITNPTVGINQPAPPPRSTSLVLKTEARSPKTIPTSWGKSASTGTRVPANSFFRGQPLSSSSPDKNSFATTNTPASQNRGQSRASLDEALIEALGLLSKDSHSEDDEGDDWFTEEPAFIASHNYDQSTFDDNYDPNWSDNEDGNDLTGSNSPPQPSSFTTVPTTNYIAMPTLKTTQMVDINPQKFDLNNIETTSTTFSALQNHFDPIRC